MSTIDNEVKARYADAPSQPQLISRAVLCTLPALADGLAAALTVIFTSLVYHLAFLQTPLSDFAWQLYSIFGLMAGVLYGIFSAIACGRFLDGEQRLRSTLPDSLYGWTAAIAITLLVAFLSGQIGDLSRVSLSSAYVVGIPLVLGLRKLGQDALAERITRGALHYERVAVVGKRGDVENFLGNGQLWRSGHHLTGTLYLEEALDAGANVRMEAIAEFARLSLKRGSESIVIVGTLADLDALERLVTEMKRFSLNVVYAPATANRTLKFLGVVPIGPNNALLFMRKPMSDAAVFLKRVSDIAMAGLGLLVLTPFFLAVALAIVIESGGPVIFRQERRGFNGETFMIWKFRSMSVMESGHDMQQVRRGDPRVTRVGRVMRKLSIDELPQLINVLLGQMSVVGPRPHAISHDAELSRQLATYAHRQRIKPGITGWAQVNGFRGETTTFEQIEGRTIHDLYYIDNWSILLDFWIIVLTVLSPATRRNAH